MCRYLIRGVTYLFLYTACIFCLRDIYFYPSHQYFSSTMEQGLHLPYGRYYRNIMIFMLVIGTRRRWWRAWMKVMCDFNWDKYFMKIFIHFAKFPDINSFY